MKKLKQLSLSLILLFLLVALPGCGEQSPSSSESLPAGPGAAAPQTVPDAGSSSLLLGVPADYPMEGFANNFEVFQSGTYVMYSTMEMRYPEFTYTMEQMQAEDGANYVFESEGDIPLNGYLHTRLLTTGGYFYNINDAEQYYFKNPDYGDEEDFDEDTGEDEFSIAFGNHEPLGTGEETFNGFVCKYEEYPSEYAPVRFYFDMQGNWVGMHGYGEGPGPDGEDVPFEYFRYIKSISPVVPASLFEPPEDYRCMN